MSLEEKLELLRKEYKEHPSKLLEIRGKMLKIAIEIRDKKNGRGPQVSLM